MDRWLVVYDIPDDGRRCRLANVLEGYGDRVQESVFEVRAEGQDLERLLNRLRAVVEDEDDSVRLYPACEACASKVILLAGPDLEPWWQPDVIII